jgi:hypothetical protein
MRFSFSVCMAVCAAYAALACGAGSSAPTVPSAATSASNVSNGAGEGPVTLNAAQPPFNLEAILRGDGFGLVKFRQEKEPGTNIVNLDIWVRDLGPNRSYDLQRAVDTILDGACTGSNWLTLGQGPTAHPIVTDDRGTGRADLWRDLSAFAAGTAFDIYFRVVEAGTTNIVLQSDCYRFVVRD